MKIIVPIKQTLDPAGILVRRDKERVFINQEAYIIEPGSKAALEAALRIKDSVGAEVTAISMGPARAEDAVREALAVGCDAGYLLCDPLFEKADLPTTAKILAAAIHKMGGADLVITGQAAGDSAAGQIGPRLAGLLDYAQITEAWQLTLEENTVNAVRQWYKGWTEVSAAFPVVVSVAPGAFHLRYSPGDRIMNAYREWQTIQWNAADLDLDEAGLAALVTYRGESFPAPLPAGEVLRGSVESQVNDILAVLTENKLLDKTGG